MKTSNTEPEFAYDEQALLQKIACSLIPTNLKGAYSIPAPPKDFDPNTASEAELIKHGIFWRRPNGTTHPAVARAWKRVFSRKWLSADRIAPHLEPQIGKTHNLGKPLRQVANQNFVGSKWAGAGINILGPWETAAGVWQIPTVSQPSEPPGINGDWNSASWVGIDGYTINPNDDVLQAGIQQEVDSQGNAHYTPWFEWYAPPQQTSPSYINQTNIMNFLVLPGHQIICVVFFLNQLRQLLGFPPGVLVLGNETTGQNFGIFLVPPPGAPARGDTVEWIMEAPNNGEPETSLPKFTPVVFNSAVASGANGVGDPQFGDSLNIETGNQLLTSVALGPETVTIDFIG